MIVAAYVKIRRVKFRSSEVPGSVHGSESEPEPVNRTRTRTYNPFKMPAFETLDPELRGVLGKRIRELGLRLEGSPVEPYVRQLYKELERRGLHKFRPVCYLTDEWGCPDMQPVLGIPFYLADPNLGKLERAIDDLEDGREIMRYMRHEAGHVFNYAYRLYTRPDWRAIFGPFDRPYRDKYRPVPFSRNYVRHMEGWYAQKHPDEDFAETFAVWLTPGSAWRRRYKGWPAMRKLRYVDRMARAFGDQEPLVRTGEVDITVDDMRLTVEEFYRRAEKERDMRIDLAMDAHLSEIFLTRKPREGRPAADYRHEIPARADRQDHVLDRRAARGRARSRRGDLQELRAPEAVGRSRPRAGVSRRADGVRHDAGDEFPDSWYLHGRQEATGESGKQEVESEKSSPRSRAQSQLLLNGRKIQSRGSLRSMGARRRRVGLERQSAARPHARQEGSRGRSRRRAHQARARAGPARARRFPEEPPRPGQARLRSHFQPQRIVRRQRHRRLQHRRLSGARREALYRARAATA